MYNAFLVIIRINDSIKLSIIKSILDFVNEVFNSWCNGFYRNELFFGALSDIYRIGDIAFTYYSLFSSFLRNTVVYVYDPNELVFYKYNGFTGKINYLKRIFTNDTRVGYVIICDKSYPRSLGIVEKQSDLLSDILNNYGLEYSSLYSRECFLEKIRALKRDKRYKIYAMYRCNNLNDLCLLIRKIILIGIFSNKIFSEKCVLKPIWNHIKAPIENK